MVKTIETYEQMSELLMSFKDFAFEKESKIINAFEQIAYDPTDIKDTDANAILKFREIARKVLEDLEKIE